MKHKREEKHFQRHLYIRIGYQKKLKEKKIVFFKLIFYLNYINYFKNRIINILNANVRVSR